MQALYISAAHKSSGKTSVAIGLCAALHQQGKLVQPFKKGPDYIDPLWLGNASGRPCHNLDPYLQTSDELVDNFSRYSANADIALIEGNKGLYDGLSVDGSDSNAALAILLGTPVILVIDCRGMTRGIAPLLIGYQQFDSEIQIAGVILNQVGGNRHETKLRSAVERYTDLPVLGAVHQDHKLEIIERHLGLMPSYESTEAQTRIAALRDAVISQVDTQRLLDICPARDVRIGPAARDITPDPKTRIGIACDSAFGFYYPGDLEALAAQGAELIYIDMCRDSELPPLDGLFIGGGFPEFNLKQLSANESMRSSVAAAIAAGMPTYAECGGLMYLCRSIEWRGEKAAMVGTIPADCRVDEKPIGKGYVELEQTIEHPWRKSEQQPKTIRAHEFHYSQISGLPQSSQFAFKVRRGTGIDGQHDGFYHNNLLACYAHLRDISENHWTEDFLQFVRRNSR